MEHSVTVINLNLIKINNRRIVANFSEQKKDEIPQLQNVTTAVSLPPLHCLTSHTRLLPVCLDKKFPLRLCTHKLAVTRNCDLLGFFARYTAAEVLAKENNAYVSTSKKVI